MSNTLMTALTHSSFGDHTNLRVRDVPRPVAGPGELLVEVATASPNPVDWHLYRGDPAVLRLLHPRFSEPRGVGEDFAGIVAEVGAEVGGWHVGDRVFGTSPAAAKLGGSVAQFVRVRPDWVAAISDSVSFAAGGVTGLAALTALQGLRDFGGLTSGARVLIWGAAGGVGHFAVQIARLLGASAVDAVVSTRSVELAHRLGADQVFDYTKHEQPEGPYDVILDMICAATLPQLRRMLAGSGTVVSVGAVNAGHRFGGGMAMLGRRAGAPWRGVRNRIMATKVNSADLCLLADWLGDERLRPLVEETFTLARAPEAYARLEAGRVRGKLAIDCSGD